MLLKVYEAQEVQYTVRNLMILMENDCSWLQSVEYYFAAQKIELREQSKVWLFVSYMSGEAYSCGSFSGYSAEFF